MRLQSCMLKVGALWRCKYRSDKSIAIFPGMKGWRQLDAGLKQGIDEDELLARQIGLSDASQMSTTQEKYKERIKQKLVEVLHSALHAYLHCF